LGDLADEGDCTPIGLPHSIILENVFAKTFDTDKLDYDIEKLREAYNDKGYFQAKVLDPEVKIVQKWRPADGACR
jgi:hypothetical protein